MLGWVAEGLQTDEINAKAAQLEDVFSVSRQQIDYYRKTREVDLQAIRSIDENTALVSGYASRETRVYKLSILAALMEKDLFGGFLWTDQVKGVGSGDIAEIVDYEEFNASEVIQYRGVLDDISKEVGGRVQRSDVTSGDKPIEARNESTDRAISTLADAIGAAISGSSAKREGPVDAPERPTVAGVSIEG